MANRKDRRMTGETTRSTSDCIAQMARDAREAQREVALLDDAAKSAALREIANVLRASGEAILSANAKDLASGRDGGLAEAMLDRLALDEGRLEGIAGALENVAQLPDPVGEVISRDDRPNGLELSRVRIPIGVIGIIYESRPNVTIDAAALCFKSGNAAILRGGSEAVHSNRALMQAFGEGLEKAGIPRQIVQLVPTQDRAAVGAMLQASGLIDMIVPRGGKSLVERVQRDARVPVLAHLDGICHTYVDRSADPETAKQVAVNAKMRRPGICGAMETLLIDSAYPAAAELCTALADSGCELVGDGRARALDPRIEEANEEDWDTEYLAPKLSIAIVDGLDAALGHIARHSSGHTDAVIATDENVTERFLSEVDSAIVMANASSQFADGGEFGLGAEIGIATGRLHARGPVALEGLTTYKWQVRGSGQTRS
ncbi:glutamate-5-semialdehyde dehydrogenase [Parapontixanthobacter aurantiacus]|nr:glutamate-5-semialdehyde dehydrogenase [Parapontixanthobacter aurantiacus]